jgi:hypothetical protein
VSDDEEDVGWGLEEEDEAEDFRPVRESQIVMVIVLGSCIN